MFNKSQVGDDKLTPNPRVYRLISWINILYGLFFICVGVPVWWKTTTVQRAWLPYKDIALLKDKSVVIGQQFEVISCDPWVSGKSLDQLEIMISNELASKMSNQADRVKVNFLGSSRDCTSQEREILRTSTTLDDFEQSLEPVRTFANKDRVLEIMLLPNSTLLFTGQSSGLLKQTGIVYLRVDKTNNELASLIQILLTRVLVVKRDIIASFNDIYRATMTQRSENLRQFRSASSYEVMFSLVNTRPEKVSVSWDMTKSLRLFADPLASKIGRYVSLSFKSQHLYYVDIPIKPKPLKNIKGMYIPQDDLPHLINPVEGFLTDSSTAQSSIHFVVYIPSESQHPLYFGYPQNGNQTIDERKKSFISPRWGGFMVYNINPTKAPIYHEVDMNKVMSVCIAQLRSLLGVSRNLPSIIPMEEPDDSGVTSWELQSWLRRRAIEQITVASMTLASLSNLLGKVGNMVIQDKIADEVLRSVDALKIAHEYIAQGLIHDAFAASKQALLASERAFFDPSLLELLYFSDDQKYAIYVPLFLPVGLPLLMGFVKGIRYLIKSKKIVEDCVKKDQ